MRNEENHSTPSQMKRRTALGFLGASVFGVFSWLKNPFQSEKSVKEPTIEVSIHPDAVAREKRKA